MNTFIGEPHKACGESLRYVANGKCVACVLARGKQRTQRKNDLYGNSKFGLPRGFVVLGSVNHLILKYILDNGPAGHAEIAAAIKRPGISVYLRRLALYKFLFKVGRTRMNDHTRSGVLYSLTHSREGLPEVRLRSRTEMTSRYRAKTRLERQRVSSVFEWRGP